METIESLETKYILTNVNLTFNKIKNYAIRQ